MASISTLIGERFEDIVQELFPELVYRGDDKNRTPDFEHPLFFAEAKVTFNQSDYNFHLKADQIDSFGVLDAVKPVVYLVGIHNYANAMKKLVSLNDVDVRVELKSMDVLRLYMVHNDVMTKIFNCNNSISGRNNIADCEVRESALTQIILDKSRRANPLISARSHFGILPDGYSFSMPILQPRLGIEVGHIMPEHLQHVTDYFYN